MPFVHIIRPSMVEAPRGNARSAPVRVPRDPWLRASANVPTSSGAASIGRYVFSSPPRSLIVAPLCRASTGTWVNYAIQGIVFVAILTGQVALAGPAMKLACAPPRSRSRLQRSVSWASRSRTLTALFAAANRAALSVEFVLSGMKAPASDLLLLRRARAGTGLTAGRTWFSTTGFTRFSSPFTSPSPGLHGCAKRSTDGSVQFVITSSEDPMIDRPRRTARLTRISSLASSSGRSTSGNDSRRRAALKNRGAPGVPLSRTGCGDPGCQRVE